jgi:hypothetical protein
MEEDPDAFDVSQQLTIKRARLRVEILKKESDEDAKFELFQRLNTGGTPLTEQEVRNCVLVMVNRPFFEWLTGLSQEQAFAQTTPLTETARSQGKAIELALRFISYRRVPYSAGLDLNEYLDHAARLLSKMNQGFRPDEARIFRDTFSLLADCLGGDVFKRWDGARHSGGFLISGFEAIAHGVASNLPSILALPDGVRNTWLVDRVRTVWGEHEFSVNSGMGVRGTTRLTNLLPFGVAHFRP